jgi:general secretion pathway protein G
MGLKALAQKPDSPLIKNWRPGGYLQTLPKDPWGNDYQYVRPGAHSSEFDIYSLGADGQTGGEGNDADIGSWNLDQ